jgi:hypothetical protein
MSSQLLHLQPNGFPQSCGLDLNLTTGAREPRGTEWLTARQAMNNR